MTPMWPSPSLADRVISTFSFDPEPLAKPTESTIEGRPSGHPGRFME